MTKIILIYAIFAVKWSKGDAQAPGLAMRYSVLPSYGTTAVETRARNWSSPTLISMPPVPLHWAVTTTTPSSTSSHVL